MYRRTWSLRCLRLGRLDVCASGAHAGHSRRTQRQCQDDEDEQGSYLVVLHRGISRIKVSAELLYVLPPCSLLGVEHIMFIMLDWSDCQEVERSDDKVSGAWVFRGTRVPVRALFENL